MARRTQPTDAVDDHVARWVDQVPEMDGAVEGAVTRMQHVLRRLKEVNAKAHEGDSLTLEDSKTLHALMIQPYPVEATPAQLADACYVTRAAMTSRVDRLVEAGLVTREVDPDDRRRVIVRPTARGRATWNRDLHAGMAREQRLLSALSARELEHLNALLRKVILSFEE